MEKTQLNILSLVDILILLQMYWTFLALINIKIHLTLTRNITSRSVPVSTQCKHSLSIVYFLFLCV